MEQHGNHGDDFEHYSKVQFLYMKDVREKMQNQNMNLALTFGLDHKERNPLALMAGSESEQVRPDALARIENNVSMQVALWNPEITKLDPQSEKEIFCSVLGINGLQQLREERRAKKTNEKVDKAMTSICRRLSLENFLTSMVPIYFTTKKFKISRSDFEETRPAFLIYVTELTADPRRML
jgi:hypothetical protein